MRDSLLLTAYLLHVPRSIRPKTPMVFVQDVGSSSILVSPPFELRKLSYHDLKDMG